VPDPLRRAMTQRMMAEVMSSMPYVRNASPRWRRPLSRQGEE
jgi:hypothetical protein